MIRTGGLEGSGDIDALGSEGVYGATLKPKNSFPNGRFNAAGTLTSDSNISLVTIFCLLQKKRQLVTPLQTWWDKRCAYDFAAIGNVFHTTVTDTLSFGFPPREGFTLAFETLPMVTTLAHSGRSARNKPTRKR